MTGSPLYLGYIGLASATSSIALNLFGGALADKLDKRRLIVITQLTTASLVFLLAVITLLEVVQVWHIILIAFVADGVGAFDQPDQQALYPHLIDRNAIVSAVALDSAVWQGMRIVAPAVAGFVISQAGTATAFFLASAGFVTMASVMLLLKVPRIESTSGGNPIHDVIDGLKFIGGSSVFSFLIGMTFFNSFFGMAYMMMMPAFAVDVLNVGADGQGLLIGMTGIGSLAITMVMSSMSGSANRGPLIVGGSAVFGISIATFSLTSLYVGSLPLALTMALVMGISNSLYMISIRSSLQLLTPDSMRGRLMGFFGMTWSIMPLGAFQSGALAEFVGVPAAVAIGGGLVTLFALGPALMNRRVRNLDVIIQERESRAVG